MGHAPPRDTRPTRLSVLRARYTRGEIEVEQFEEQVERLLHTGKENERVGPSPPPNTARREMR